MPLPEPLLLWLPRTGGTSALLCSRPLVLRSRPLLSELCRGLLPPTLDPSKRRGLSCLTPLSFRPEPFLDPKTRHLFEQHLLHARPLCLTSCLPASGFWQKPRSDFCCTAPWPTLRGLLSRPTRRGVKHSGPGCSVCRSPLKRTG